MKRQKGFTLIELLVVIAIIGILATTLLTVLPGIMLNMKKSACRLNLQRHLYPAMFIYAENNGGAYPVGKEFHGANFWEVLRTLPAREDSPLGRDVDKHQRFLCPVRAGQGDYGISHYRGPNYDVTGGTFDDMPIAADLAGNHPDDTVNVLYKGGAVKEVKRGTDEWERVEKYLTEK